jgi:hypothetical protein
MAGDTVASAIRDLERLAGLNDAKARASLGRALGNLSNRLWEAGSVIESVSPAREAVSVFASVDAAGLDGIAARNNLAFRLADVGDVGAALEHLLIACDQLDAGIDRGERSWEVHRGTLLNNMTCVWLGLRDFVNAADSGLEAVNLRRRLALADRDRHLPYIARSLSNASIPVAAAGDVDQGRRLIAEARTLHSITGRRAPIFRFEEAESAVIDAIIRAVDGDTVGALRALNAAREHLTSVGEALGPLGERLNAAIDHNVSLIESGTTPTWNDVRAVGATDAVSGGFDVPLLLEYKDL